MMVKWESADGVKGEKTTMILIETGFVWGRQPLSTKGGFPSAMAPIADCQVTPAMHNA